MKRFLAVALFLTALGGASPARAQVFGQFTGAAVVAPNQHVFGAYLNASENVIGGLAQLRLSFYPNLDFGFHGGLTRLDPGPNATSLTTLRVGADVRWQVAHVSQEAAADVAVGGALGVETASHLTVVSLGPSVVASRALGGLVPYAGMGALFISRDQTGRQTTDLAVPLRVGTELRLSPGLRVVAELQVMLADRYSDDVGFAVGANMPF